MDSPLSDNSVQDPSKLHRCIPFLAVLTLRVDPSKIPAQFFKDIFSRVFTTALAEIEGDWKHH